MYNGDNSKNLKSFDNTPEGKARAREAGRKAGIASGIVETQTEDVEELSRIGSMIVFGLDVAYDWFCDVASDFCAVSGVIWFLRLRNAKDLTSNEHAL